jgi:hypothetical protein
MTHTGLCSSCSGDGGVTVTRLGRSTCVGVCGSGQWFGGTARRSDRALNSDDLCANRFRRVVSAIFPRLGVVWRLAIVRSRGYTTCQCQQDGAQAVCGAQGHGTCRVTDGLFFVRIETTQELWLRSRGVAQFKPSNSNAPSLNEYSYVELVCSDEILPCIYAVLACQQALLFEDEQKKKSFYLNKSYISRLQPCGLYHPTPTFSEIDKHSEALWQRAPS